jgi:hypothetical protein
MGTLTEIESATESLPKEQQRELLLFLLERLRADGSPLPEPRVFSDEQMKAWMDEDEADMRRFQAGV